MAKNKTNQNNKPQSSASTVNLATSASFSSAMAALKVGRAFAVITGAATASSHRIEARPVLLQLSAHRPNKAKSKGTNMYALLGQLFHVRSNLVYDLTRSGVKIGGMTERTTSLVFERLVGVINEAAKDIWSNFPKQVTSEHISMWRSSVLARLNGSQSTASDQASAALMLEQQIGPAIAFLRQEADLDDFAELVGDRVASWSLALACDLDVNQQEGSVPLETPDDVQSTESVKTEGDQLDVPSEESNSTPSTPRQLVAVSLGGMGFQVDLSSGEAEQHPEWRTVGLRSLTEGLATPDELAIEDDTLKVIVGKTGSGKTRAAARLSGPDSTILSFYEAIPSGVFASPVKSVWSTEDVLRELIEARTKVVCIDSIRRWTFTGRGATASGGFSVEVLFDLMVLRALAHMVGKQVIVTLNPVNDAMPDNELVAFAQRLGSSVTTILSQKKHSSISLTEFRRDAARTVADISNVLDDSTSIGEGRESLLDLLEPQYANSISGTTTVATTSRVVRLGVPNRESDQ